MSKKFILAVLIAVCSPAFADGLMLSPTLSLPTTGSLGQQQGQATTTTSDSNAGISGNIGNNTFNSSSTGSHIPPASPTAPMLTTSNDTCMGSTSGSLTSSVVGVSMGTTWTDANCVRLKNAREMWNMGMRGAAIALLCMDELNNEALESTGFKCPERRQKK